jgi:uncharacterized protein YdeI (YjbR/CyaY-like superfamily)
MKLGQTLYVSNRKAWRAWLRRNHAREKEIWLIYDKKHSSKPRIPYNDAVEEALCYGWIDSTIKRIDHNRMAQRFSPRRAKSVLSETNKERVLSPNHISEFVSAGSTPPAVARKSFNSASVIF